MTAKVVVFDGGHVRKWVDRHGGKFVAASWTECGPAPLVTLHASFSTDRTPLTIPKRRRASCLWFAQERMAHGVIGPTRRGAGQTVLADSSLLMSVT